MSPDIRPWTLGDLTLCHQVAVAASGLNAWPLIAYDESYRADRLGLVMRGGMIASSVIGCLVGQIVLDEAELHDIQLLPSYQGSGMAADLLQHFLTECRKRSILRVTLEVRESNARARAFYVKHGFTQVGRRAGYYAGRKGQPSEAALILALVFELDPRELPF